MYHNVQVAGWSAAGGHKERIATYDLLLFMALAGPDQSPRVACSAAV